jgi:cell fate regulator YaaT (PSP1 superfamily)/nitrite reductase/ring-hydroxylating ferredoxin subunit
MAYYTSIRYGKLRQVARFKTDREDLRVRDRALIRTDRGKEVGEVLSPLQPLPEAIAPESLWDVVRRAAPEDLVMADRVEKESVPRALAVCRELIRKLKLPMKVSDVEYLLGGERVIFYFTSETRVDFRELVRHLAQEFRTRIDLKQVGARDQARLVGDIGHCGLELCCRSHLKDLGGITMDMAKVQKHTADPSKITGRCGKLLCCLRYEYPLYKEARELLPARGARVATAKGAGFVVDQNMLLREVTIQPEAVGGERYVARLDELVGAPPMAAGCNGCAAPAAGEAPAPGAPESAPPASAPVPPPPRPAPPPRKERPVPAAPARLSDAGFWMSLGSLAELPPGAAKVYEIGGTVKLALFNVDGVVHALTNECSHQDGPLGEGRFEGFSVTCPLHQWKFDVTTGHCLSVSGASVRKWEAATVRDEICVRIGGRTLPRKAPPPAAPGTLPAAEPPAPPPSPSV